MLAFLSHWEKRPLPPRRSARSGCRPKVEELPLVGSEDEEKVARRGNIASQRILNVLVLGSLLFGMASWADEACAAGSARCGR